jgi:hypothetical protein
LQACLLEANIVVGVKVIDPDNILPAQKQGLGDVISDKAGCPC